MEKVGVALGQEGKGLGSSSDSVDVEKLGSRMLEISTHKIITETEDMDMASLGDWVPVMLLTSMELPSSQQVWEELIISTGDILSYRNGL